MTSSSGSGDYFELPGGRCRWKWSREETAKVTRSIKLGENQFYTPPQLPGDPTVHTWSFAEVEYAVALVANTYQYDLPDDFGGFVESYLYFSSNFSLGVIRLTSIDQILDLRSTDTLITSDYPEWAAVSSQDIAQTTGQRFQISFWPTPAASKTVTGQYKVNANAMTDAASYPLGGQPHSQTLMQSCLAAAEMEKLGKPGPHYELFMQRLAGSIAYDRKTTTPKHFGKNLDNSRFERFPNIRRHRASGITYDGGF
jgi:hypothetical protein